MWPTLRAEFEAYDQGRDVLGIKSLGVAALTPRLAALELASNNEKLRILEQVDEQGALLKTQGAIVADMYKMLQQLSAASTQPRRLSTLPMTVATPTYPGVFP